MNFEEQILEAAKSIAAATSALVKAASAAQRELVAQGKVGWPQMGKTSDRDQTGWIPAHPEDSSSLKRPEISGF